MTQEIGSIASGMSDRSRLLERISVHPDILERFPGFRLCVVFALGLRNVPSTAQSRNGIRAAAERGVARLGSRSPREFDSIKNWREAYSAFGAKPSAYPCSAESLIQRALKNGGDAVPSINLLVDIYNSVSLAHLMPIGGEDLDQIAGRCQLRFACTDDCNRVGLDDSNVPSPGEVIWADGLGWTCRRWNWRQGVRTRLTEATRNACFIIEGMASSSYEPDLAAATEDLCNRIGECLKPERLEMAWVVHPSVPRGDPLTASR